jgi:hypothetical protein
VPPLLLLIFLCCTACAASSTGPENSRPGLRQVLLTPEWSYVGEQKITLRNPVADSTLTTTDFIRTEIFFRPDTDTPDVLLLSRVNKAGHAVIFSVLGGTKTEIEGRTYRENVFGVFSNSTDREYCRYFDMLRQNNIPLAPAYHVRVLDRLPVDTTLVRAMELTPARIADTLPPFGKLYPQEKEERFFRGSFLRGNQR